MELVGPCLRCLDDDQIIHSRPPGFHPSSESCWRGVRDGMVMAKNDLLTRSSELYARPSEDGRMIKMGRIASQQMLDTA